jgi:hypothetical protein
MIFELNSTALATVMEVIRFSSIHLVDLYAATKNVCECTFSLFERAYQVYPHIEKGQVIGMVHN